MEQNQVQEETNRQLLERVVGISTDSAISDYANMIGVTVDQLEKMPQYLLIIELFQHPHFVDVSAS